MSSRTSPQAGVVTEGNACGAIPPKEVKSLNFSKEMSENSGDCHASVRTGTGFVKDIFLDERFQMDL